MPNPQTSLFPSPAERSSANGNTLIVIDGHALAFRSYYAIRELTNSKGQATNAVFGFVRSLLRILTEGEDETTTVVTFDAPAKTFRHEAYKDYKAGRAPTPDDLPGQIEMIKEIEAAGFEFMDYSDLHYRAEDELIYEVGRKTVTGNTDRFTLLFRKP